MNDEQEKLFLDNLNLVGKVISNMKLNYEEFCDLGWIALCKAVYNFDKSKNLKFSTYAYTTIRGEILNARPDRRKHGIPLDKIIYGDTPINEGENILFDVILGNSNYYNMENEIIYKNSLDELLMSLSDIDKQIIFYLYKGLSQTQISNIVNISQNSISRRKKLLLKKFYNLSK